MLKIGKNVTGNITQVHKCIILSLLSLDKEREGGKETECKFT